jgi:hypothetical protein
MSTLTAKTTRTLFSSTALDRNVLGHDFLPADKVIQFRATTHSTDHGIISSSTLALSLEEALELIAELSSAIEEATAFTK